MVKLKTLKSAQKVSYHKLEKLMKGSFKIAENMGMDCRFFIENIHMRNTMATGRWINMKVKVWKLKAILDIKDSLKTE